MLRKSVAVVRHTLTRMDNGVEVVKNTHLTSSLQRNIPFNKKTMYFLLFLFRSYQ